MDSSLTQDPKPSTGRLGSQTAHPQKMNTFHSSGISSPQLFPRVPGTESNCIQMLLLKSEVEAVTESKEEQSGRETYIREKANQLTCQLSPCR